MTKDEFQIAIVYLTTNTISATDDIDGISRKEVILPFDIFPDELPNGTEKIFHFKADWDEYQWNPPQYWSNEPGYEEYDKYASAKPTWERLTEAIDLGWIQTNVVEIQKQINRERVRRLKLETNTTTDTELILHLIDNPIEEGAVGFGEPTPVRTVLRQREAALRAWATDPARTREELENIDIYSDSQWEAP